MIVHTWDKFNSLVEATKLSIRNPLIPKAEGGDFVGRFREIVSDSINSKIKRVALSGYVSDGLVYLHNGNKVPAFGDFSYYGDFSDILIINSGVHEPLEEFCFQEIIEKINVENPYMIELGSYWSHYSMWLKKRYPSSIVNMVESDEHNLLVGQNNFDINKYTGDFINDFVGKSGFKVDDFILDQHVNILHADIQGYEMEMLLGAEKSLKKNQIDYVFLSSHSQELHYECYHFLESSGYYVLVSSDFDNQTTSFDGFILGVSSKVLE